MTPRLTNYAASALHARPSCPPRSLFTTAQLTETISTVPCATALVQCCLGGW